MGKVRSTKCQRVGQAVCCAIGPAAGHDKAGLHASMYQDRCEWIDACTGRDTVPICTVFHPSEMHMCQACSTSVNGRSRAPMQVSG
jgi:hypothetical protein